MKTEEEIQEEVRNMTDEEIQKKAEEFLEEEREEIRVRFNRARDYEDAEKRGIDTSEVPKLNETLKKRKNAPTRTRAYNEMYLLRAELEKKKEEEREAEELVRELFRQGLL